MPHLKFSHAPIETVRPLPDKPAGYGRDALGTLSDSRVSAPVRHIAVRFGARA